MIKQYWRCHRTEEEELVGSPREGRVVFVEDLREELENIVLSKEELKEREGLFGQKTIEYQYGFKAGDYALRQKLLALLESPSAKKDKEKEERKSNG